MSTELQTTQEVHQQKFLVRSLFLVFLLSAAESWALPPCPGSYDQNTWDNCQGTYTFASGNKYVGAYKDDLPNGQGTFTHVDGSKYVGATKDGSFHGQGTLTLADGTKYVGAFKDDLYHGHGTYTEADGSKYVGATKDGNFHGHGTFTFANGNKYVGEWKDDKRDGQGTYTYADGSVQEGLWENNEFLYAKKATPRKPPTVITDDGKVIAAASGTGFAVTRSGHIVTNHHVINGCNDVKVHYDGKIIPATVLSKDPLNDLAVLKADFKPTTVLPLSKKNPELMEDVFVAGFPFGKSLSSSVKITKGIISSLTGLGDNFSNIQIDAAIQPGNSGGPIFDEKGNVVAVAVAKLDLKKVIEHLGTIPENTNFGIKANIVSNLLASNNITPGAPNTKTVSKSKLGKTVSNATYYLSCWMTMAKIQKMQSQKVIFSDLTQ